MYLFHSMRSHADIAIYKCTLPLQKITSVHILLYVTGVNVKCHSLEIHKDIILFS